MRLCVLAPPAALLLVAALTPVATGAVPVLPPPSVLPPKPLVGLADQKPSMFADPRFVGLGVRQARINLPWDVLRDPVTRQNVDTWMFGAKLDRVAPLVTIQRSRRPGHQSDNPSPTVLAAQVRSWRLRWPGQIRQLSTWNEANLGKRPELVAKWWLAIRRVCPGCTVLGADLVDRPDAVSWAQRFIKAAGRRPAVWGLHNYIDTNTFRTTGTRAFLKGVTGRIWLTETGGVLRRSRPTVRFSGTGSAHAAKATNFLLNYLVPIDPRRIQRVYLYSWSSAPNDLTWDSGLIGPDGKARPALRIVRCYLGSCRAKLPPPPPAPVPPAADDVPAPPAAPALP